jgi:4-hydroxybenzoate polyprenyltransferase
MVLLKVFFELEEFVTRLNPPFFTVFVLAVSCIAAGGYIINDIKDYEADLINKPNKVIVGNAIRFTLAFRLYKLLNVMGIIGGIAVSLHIERPSYAFFYMGTAAMLFAYAKKIKGMPIIGNLVVALLIGVVVLLVVLTDLPMGLKPGQTPDIKGIATLLICFAISLNWVREIVKDILDVDGDRKMQLRTIPILIGRKRSATIAAIIGLFPIAILLFVVFSYGEYYRYTVLYLLFIVFIPLLYIQTKLLSFQSTHKLIFVSKVLKFTMFTGMNALLVYTLFD